MTHVYYSKDKDRHELSAIGHANYDEQGKDIVCSAVSAINYALIGFLENSTGMYDYFIKDGFLTAWSDRSRKRDAAFEMAIIGLEQIAQQYPDNVTLHYISAIGGDSREETANT